MFLIGIVLSGICLFVVMWWWSEGFIEASDAIILAIVLSGLAFGLFAVHSLWQFIITFLALAGVVGYIAYSFRLGGNRSFYKRRCQSYMNAIQADPKNVGARESLADMLHNMGELDRAIDELQAAVDMGAGFECNSKLAKWSKERYMRDTLNPVCRWCETENIMGVRQCSKCGSDLPYDNALTQWLMGGKDSKLRYYLLCIAGIAIVGISLALLPPKLAFIPLLFCIISIIGWILISSART